MKFGSKITAYGESNPAFQEILLDYNKLKEEIKDNQQESFRKDFLAELSRIDECFITAEKDLCDELSDIQHLKSNDPVQFETRRRHLIVNAKELMNCIQWNAIAVRKILKKYHRWIGVASLPHRESWYLNQTSFYQSLIPARVLVRAQCAQDDATQQCPVCMDNFNDAVMCSCGHSFCYCCVRKTDTCPMCRKPHNRHFVQHGTGEFVDGATESSSITTSIFNRVLDWMWYIIIFALMLPFAATMGLIFLLMWVLRSGLDTISGNRVHLPAPLKYQRVPRVLRPHYANTEQPPWSFPSLWE